MKFLNGDTKFQNLLSNNLERNWDFQVVNDLELAERNNAQKITWISSSEYNEISRNLFKAIKIMAYVQD